MADRKEALQELLDKIESGDDDIKFGEFDTCFSRNAFSASIAHNGSLDAAKSLHDAVFPYADWSLCSDSHCVITDQIFPFSVMGVGQSPMKPARAWLIAIIKALIAQESE